MWLPPANYNGSVIFRATVVQVKQAYYDQIYSRPVYFRASQLIDEKTFQNDVEKKPMMGDQPPATFASSTSNGLDYDLCRNHVCIGLGESGCLTSHTCMALLTGKYFNKRKLYLKLNFCCSQKSRCEKRRVLDLCSTSGKQ